MMAGSVTSTGPRQRARNKKNKSTNVSVDKPLATALASLLFGYTTITLATYWRLSASPVSRLTSGQPMSLGADFSTGGNQGNSVSGVANLQVVQQKPAAVENDPVFELQHHSFPLHVGDDVELIPHPGLEAAHVLHPNMAPHLFQDLPPNMTVPKFFDDSHGSSYPGGSIREYLGNYGEHLMTPEQASKIGSFNSDGHETIYVSIANYRDPECTGTLEDLMARAKYPDRVRVAVLDQFIPNGDENEPRCSIPIKPCTQDPEQALCKYRHLLDIFEMDARLAIGPVFARHLAHRHYRGEYFAMQIDSHVRMTQDWDESIVNEWKHAQNEYAVLSTYVSDIRHAKFDEHRYSQHISRPIMCDSGYEGRGDNKHLRHGQQPEGPAGIHGEPTFDPFWAAGFSFARGHFIIQVPYDQYMPMVFQGEEIAIGLRGFTYGYDYYAPERGICFHMYAHHDEKDDKRGKVHKFWENDELYRGTDVYAMRRLNTIIGMARHDKDKPWDSREIKKYGLGKIRKTQTFFDVFGIHTETQTVEGHLCRFVGKTMFKIFKPALRKNRMGVDYSKIDYRFVDQWKDEKND